jgi:hypothetical protein
MEFGTERYKGCSPAPGGLSVATPLNLEEHHLDSYTLSPYKRLSYLVYTYSQIIPLSITILKMQFSILAGLALLSSAVTASP